MQVQWEQKFVCYVQYVRVQVKLVSKGVSYVVLGGMVLWVVQEIWVVCEQWECDNGFISNGNGLEVVGVYGGGVFELLDIEEWGCIFEVLDCLDWCDD